MESGKTFSREQWRFSAFATKLRRNQSIWEKVKYVPFKAIYSSTAKRARDTAEGINKELARPVEIFIQIS